MAKKEKEKAEKTTFRLSPGSNCAALINWQEWGNDAFRQSQNQHKPVLLSISAVWCHWCHVMDETSYSDSEVISLINEKFIPVRVDSDRRPDINSRYNQGGWPTIAFLTHDGEIIAGTTYLPPDQLRRLLIDISNLYSNNIAQIRAAVSKIQQQRQQRPAPQAADPTPAVMAKVIEVIGETHDKQFGGFGSEPKFPYPAALSFLLVTLADGYIEVLDEMLKTTLNAMLEGEIYDSVEGGFFRYATRRDWTAPHFEKMLEDNAALMAIYTDAFHLTGDKRYERVAREIHRYLTTVLLDNETGAFAGSQEADEGYYQPSSEKRQKERAPYVDRTVYANLNAMAASALLKAFQIFGDRRFYDEALRVMDFLWGNLWSTATGPYHYYDGEPHLPGLLTDTARLLPACIDAYESGAGEKWLDRALDVAGWLLDNLEDEESGGFYDCKVTPGIKGYPSEPSKPIVENSVAAAALIRLAMSTGQTRFSDSARRTLSYFSENYQQHGIFAADYAAAVQRLLDPPVRVTIVGPPTEKRTVEMIRAAHSARIPFRSVEILDPAVHGAELEETGFGYAGEPIAYICIGASCQPPVFNPADLAQRLEKGRHL